MGSDVLAKLYMEPFDSRLQEANFKHMRYTDDLRLYTQSEEEAKRGLVAITRILRARGLTLQSQKTQIRPVAHARGEFDGIVPAIERVRKGYIDEVVAAGLMAADVSLPMAAIDDLVGENIETEVLHRAFDAFVIRVDSPNKSMLNFLLGHLGRQGDDFAVDECARRLGTHPERTPSIARYFQNLERPGELESIVVAALSTETGAIYPYQRYLLLDWLNRNADSLTEESVAVVRQLSFRAESPHYVQATARRLLGRFGTHSDLEEIETLFKSTSEPLQRAQLLCCLQGLEKSRRNGIAARVDADKGWVGRAAAFVRS